MKNFTFAVLGFLLIASTDAVAATDCVSELANPATVIHTTEKGKVGGWIKRKKRRNTPAYRRPARLRHR